MKISIAIPCYEMKPYGDIFLDFSLEKIYYQTYKNINVVVSDHSKDDSIKNVCDKWSGKIDIKYIRKRYNTECPSDNLNVAMSNCDGDYIKILFQDDYLYNAVSIQKTVDAINANPDVKWFASTSEHSNDGITCYRRLTPRWNDDMWCGHNSISSPSVITLKNDKDLLFFDHSLVWLMDCDYYQNCYNNFGLPVFIDEITVVNRTWQNQLTNVLSDEKKNSEFEIVNRKYGKVTA